VLVVELSVWVGLGYKECSEVSLNTQRKPVSHTWRYRADESSMGTLISSDPHSPSVNGLFGSLSLTCRFSRMIADHGTLVQSPCNDMCSPLVVRVHGRVR
jgi:hypothetical protein